MYLEVSQDKMYLKSSTMLSQSIKALSLIACLILKLQIVSGDSTTEESIISTIGSTISPSVPTISPKSITINSSSKKPILIENRSSSINIPLFGENLKLNLSALENNVEFSVIVNNSPQQKSSEFSQQISKAKRLLIGFDDENHFNVDILALTFINDTNGKIAFGNKIQDLAWNKRNGVLLPDADQSYKWIASGAEKNGSNFFVTFTRSWLTCDKQDIQFHLSAIKIWWLIDNDEDAILTKGQTKASSTMAQMFEKQLQGSSEPVTEISIGDRTTDISAITGLISSTIPSVSINVSKSNINSTTGKKSKPLNNTRDSKPEEVEILKSIEEYNFRGPVNISMTNFLKNVTRIILKRCEVPNVAFQCNQSDYNSLSKSNNTYLPVIWKVILNKNPSNSTEKFPEHQIESCRSAFRIGSIANTKVFNALSGKSKGSSKNSGYAQHSLLKIDVFMHGMIFFAFKIVTTF